MNSIFNVIPFFFLSFYKAPKVVIQDIIKIQRDFLWCGEEHEKRINWVSYETICKLKQHGGLGVKDCNTFNKALLSKWAWKTLSIRDLKQMWYSILVFRYGDIKGLILDSS